MSDNDIQPFRAKVVYEGNEYEFDASAAPRLVCDGTFLREGNAVTYTVTIPVDAKQIDGLPLLDSDE